MANRDFLGALDASRNALNSAKMRIEKESINILIGQIYFEMGLYEFSCESFFKAVKIDHVRQTAYFCLGRNMYYLKKYKLALLYFEKALTIDGIEDFSGAILEWINKIKEATINTTNKLNEVDLAKHLIKLKEYEQAKAILRPLLDIGNINADVLYAQILILQTKYEDARNILLNILQMYPYNVEGLLGLCMLCVGQNDYENLEIILEKLDALELSDKQLYAQADMYNLLGKYEKSIKKYEKIVKNNEFNTKPLLYLSICYYNLNDRENALYYIGKARWVDIDNPIFNIYYDIFNRNTVKTPLKISNQIPFEIYETKLSDIYSAINSSNFCENLVSSYILVDDIEWAYCLDENNISEDITRVLSQCRKEKARNLYNKLLLSTRISKEQKFKLTKYTLLNNPNNEIDFTINFKYRSFKYKLPKNICGNLLLKKGYCNAIAFAEINDLSVNFTKIINKMCSFDWFTNVDLNVDENVVACLFLCEKQSILYQACIYFGIEYEMIKNTIKKLSLI